VLVADEGPIEDLCTWHTVVAGVVAWSYAWGTANISGESGEAAGQDKEAEWLSGGMVPCSGTTGLSRKGREVVWAVAVRHHRCRGSWRCRQQGGASDGAAAQGSMWMLIFLITIGGFARA
jgi:hypothetical protein